MEGYRINEVWGLFINDGNGKQLLTYHGIFTSEDVANDYAEQNGLLGGVEIKSIPIVRPKKKYATSNDERDSFDGRMDEIQKAFDDAHGALDKLLMLCAQIDDLEPAYEKISVMKNRLEDVIK